MPGKILAFLRRRRITAPTTPVGLASQANKLTRLMQQAGHHEWCHRQYCHPDHERDMDRVLAKARRLVKENEPLAPLFGYLLRLYGMDPGSLERRSIELSKRTGCIERPLAA